MTSCSRAERSKHTRWVADGHEQIDVACRSTILHRKPCRLGQALHPCLLLIQRSRVSVSCVGSSCHDQRALILSYRGAFAPDPNRTRASHQQGPSGIAAGGTAPVACKSSQPSLCGGAELQLKLVGSPSTRRSKSLSNLRKSLQMKYGLSARSPPVGHLQ
jgi:hypothetical protein